MVNQANILEIINIRKTYLLGQIKVPALQGVTLKLKKGEFTALIGASGSGKSTLLNIIGSIDEPDSGQIFLEGNDITHLSDEAKSQLRNRKIGFIFQSFNLVPVLNVYENVELPLLINPGFSVSERRNRVRSAIQDVGLEALKNNLPDQLSGGQRQRVAIARALAGNPILVLADEPTANLDSVTSHKIIDLMFDLNSNRKTTFLLSTHDERLLGRVSRVIQIHDGHIHNAQIRDSQIHGGQIHTSEIHTSEIHTAEIQAGEIHDGLREIHDSPILHEQPRP